MSPLKYVNNNNTEVDSCLGLSESLQNIYYLLNNQKTDWYLKYIYHLLHINNEKGEKTVFEGRSKNNIVWTLEFSHSSTSRAPHEHNEQRVL